MLSRCSDCAFASAAAGDRRSCVSQSYCHRHLALMPATQRREALSNICQVKAIVSVADRQLVHSMAKRWSACTEYPSLVTSLRGKRDERDPLVFAAPSHRIRRPIL
jgi:hypothetical protein